MFDTTLVDPKKLREKFCWTQVELARVLGVSSTTVVRWEKFSTTPNITIQKCLLREIAKIADEPKARKVMHCLLVECRNGTFRGAYRLLQHLYDKDSFNAWIEAQP